MKLADLSSKVRFPFLSTSAATASHGTSNTMWCSPTVLSVSRDSPSFLSGFLVMLMSRINDHAVIALCDAQQGADDGRHRLGVSSPKDREENQLNTLGKVVAIASGGFDVGEEANQGELVEDAEFAVLHIPTSSYR